MVFSVMRKQYLGAGLLSGLALLSAGGPFGIDVYLPALPAIAEDLGTTPALMQLTLTGFLAGMAVGQLFIGPLSDAHGRHRLMVGGALLATLSAVACALSPSIGVLVCARFLQGAGLGSGVVLSRATVSDLAEGSAVAKAFSLLMMIQGVAPVVAPVLGGFLLEPIGWRGLFWVLAGISAAQLAVAVFLIRESRPPEERTTGGFRFGAVLRNREFIGYLLAFAFGFGTMFSYIAASPYLFQNQLGFSPRAFSIIFGINAVGIALSSFINSKLVERTEPFNLLVRGLLVMLGCAVILLVDSLFGPHPWLAVPVLFLAISQIGFIMGNATALGTSAVRPLAGTGAAVMGACQFVVAGTVSPLVVLGSNFGLSMAMGMACCATIGLVGLRLASR